MGFCKVEMLESGTRSDGAERGDRRTDCLDSSLGLQPSFQILRIAVELEVSGGLSGRKKGQNRVIDGPACTSLGERLPG